MKLTITEKKENPLLNRLEVKGSLSFTRATPSNEETKKAVANELKTTTDLVVVKGIYTVFGETKAVFNADVYKKKEDLESTEPRPKKAKKREAEKKPAEKPAEEKPKEEKPVEKSKEEK